MYLLKASAWGVKMNAIRRGDFKRPTNQSANQARAPLHRQAVLSAQPRLTRAPAGQERVALDRRIGTGSFPELSFKPSSRSRFFLQYILMSSSLHSVTLSVHVHHRVSPSWPLRSELDSCSSTITMNTDEMDCVGHELIAALLLWELAMVLE